MEYSDYTKHKNQPVDGFILQAPISDREWAEYTGQSELQDAIDVAKKLIADGKSDYIVPRDKAQIVAGVPITAYRLHSLVAKGYVFGKRKRQT